MARRTAPPHHGEKSRLGEKVNFRSVRHRHVRKNIREPSTLCALSDRQFLVVERRQIWGLPGSGPELSTCVQIIAKNGNGGRPQNSLLQSLSAKDFKTLQSHLDESEVQSGQTLYHHGDIVESLYFSCGPTLLSYAVAVDEDREIDAVLIGREGVAGGVVAGGRVASYCRVGVKIGGPIVRLSARRLDEAERQSNPLQQLFARYADCLVAQICQSTACNAAHSIEQRNLSKPRGKGRPLSMS